MTGWIEILDALEASASGLEAIAAGNGEDLVDAIEMHDVTWVRPGALPVDLRDRATAVLARLQAAEAALAARRTTITNELALVTGGSTAPVARYIDTTA